MLKNIATTYRQSAKWLGDWFKKVKQQSLKNKVIIGCIFLFVIVAGVGAFVYAKPPTQTALLDDKKDAPVQQTTASATQKPEQEKALEPAKDTPPETKADQNKPALPEQQKTPTRLQIKTEFRVLGVSYFSPRAWCMQRNPEPMSSVTLAQPHITLQSPSHTGPVTYRWEITGSTTGLHGTFPEFGVVKTGVPAPGTNYVDIVGRIEAEGILQKPFSVRVHVLSPNDVVGRWQQIPASATTCNM